MGAPKKCDRKCVPNLIAKTRKRYKGADFWIPGGAANMYNIKTRKNFVGWPVLKFKRPALKKDGTPAKGKFITSYFAIEFCPICGGRSAP